jgi:hypothetical protein
VSNMIEKNTHIPLVMLTITIQPNTTPLVFLDGSFNIIKQILHTYNYTLCDSKISSWAVSQASDANVGTEEQRKLCMLTNQFNGLIEPASSYKTTDISNGVQKYMDDIEEIVEERIKRVRRPLSTLVPTLPTPAQHNLAKK